MVVGRRVLEANKPSPILIQSIDCEFVRKKGVGSEMGG